MKAIVFVVSRIDEHILITTLADPDLKDSYISHNIDEAATVIKGLLEQLEKAPIVPGEPRTAKDWEKYLDDLSKKEH